MNNLREILDVRKIGRMRDVYIVSKGVNQLVRMFSMVWPR